LGILLSKETGSLKIFSSISTFGSIGVGDAESSTSLLSTATATATVGSCPIKYLALAITTVLA
jgi:hypothetical protein